MSLRFSTTLRTARAQAIIDACGSNAKMKFYNGTQPATGGAETTLLATLTGSTTIGTASSGAINFDEAGFTQSNASHVSGTPTWVRLTTSADAFVADISIGAGGMTFTGTVVTGVDITLGATSITEGNA
jgi:hypothetical protein